MIHREGHLVDVVGDHIGERRAGTGASTSGEKRGFLLDGRNLCLYDDYPISVNAQSRYKMTNSQSGRGGMTGNTLIMVDCRNAGESLQSAWVFWVSSLRAKQSQFSLFFWPETRVGEKAKPAKANWRGLETGGGRAEGGGRWTDDAIRTAPNKANFKVSGRMGVR